MVKLERRLPGVRFEMEPEPLREALPRMDIAVFAGFASSGPLHLPVAIEDSTQFETIFGPDAFLAWDPLIGEYHRSLLGSAVRSFFANGGQRCWVIRVAGQKARSNCFPLAGLVVARFDKDGNPPVLEPAFGRARSEGAWSDNFECTTGLRITAFGVNKVNEGGGVIEVPGTLESAPKPGDLLRLTFRESGSSFLLFAPVDAATTILQGSPAVTAGVRLESNRPIWFQDITPKHLPVAEIPVCACLYSARGLNAEAPSVESQRQDESTLLPYVATVVEHQGWLQWPTGSPLLRLALQLARASAPAPGELVRLDVTTELSATASPPAKERWWLTIDHVTSRDDATSPSQEFIDIFGKAVREITPPTVLLTQLDSAEILEFDLRVRCSLSESYTLRRLGFAPIQANYWDALPTDKEFYTAKQSPFLQGKVEQSFELGRRNPDRSIQGVRFPMAGMAIPDAVFLPLGMDVTLARFIGRSRDGEDPLSRNGLANFEISLFLDDGLADVGMEGFMAQADFIRYLCPSPRMLRGIHAALGTDAISVVEEATLIAVPDAVHRGWKSEVQVSPEEPWWLELPFSPQTQLLPCDSFQDCAVEVLETPVFTEGQPPDQTGTFRLRWQPITTATLYRLEESAFPDFSGAVAVYLDKLPEATLYGRSPGFHYYRVRAECGSLSSQWSWSLRILVGAASGPFMVKPEKYESDTLLAVQRALLRMCAGRGDLLAVLSLPQHYRGNDAIDHLQDLQRYYVEDALIRPPGRPLHHNEAKAFSYGALYHPWLISRTTEGSLRYFPPDGAACGILAAKALSRGVWVAPANESFREVIALAPRLPEGNWQRLQAAQINVVRHDPRGFLVLSADTLSHTEELRPISVRRLLILLRRLALKRGATYVFEPLNDTFRRAVQRQFEAVLQLLFQRGAFAGVKPDSSYQVVTGREMNAPEAVDRGQFFVDLRVAPSLPMTFLTVRLIQSGDRLVAVETR